MTLDWEQRIALVAMLATYGVVALMLIVGDWVERNFMDNRE